MALSTCSWLFLALTVCLIPLLSFLLPSDYYLFELMRILYRVNTNRVLSTQQVNWLKVPSKAITSAAVTARPNILFILADDLGYNDLSGGAGVATPHIDSLAASGLRFPQAYASQATCAPSRAALFTGRMPTKLGFEFTPTPKFFGKFIGDMTKRANFELPPIYRSELYNSCPKMEDIALPSNVTMLAEHLRQIGYRNYYLGKWDSGFRSPYTPLDRGYDESLAFLMGAMPYGDVSDPSIIKATNSSLDFLLYRVTNFHIQHNNGPKFRPDRYLTDYLTEHTVSLIEALAARNQPWLITLAYNAPHNPFQATKEDYEHEDLRHIEDHNLRVYAGNAC
jgi:arylsulfatase A-like enzyme